MDIETFLNLGHPEPQPPLVVKSPTMPSMLDPIEDFANSCKAAGIAPTAVLKAADLHPSLWWRWKKGTVSPTLRSFAAVSEKLAEIKSAKQAA